MILNSERSQSEQSCCVRSLGARKGGAQKQTTHQETKTKLSSATPNYDKNDPQPRQAQKKGIQPAMSQRNRHLAHAMLRKPATTTPKQFQTIWCFGKDWQHALLLQAGLETFNQQPFPGILLIRWTCKSRCCLLKLHWFWQKGHCSNLIFGAVKDDPGRR